MLIVDSHCHASPYWFMPIETLLGEMDRNGVEKAVLVQMRGQLDNAYLIECMRRFPGRFSAAVVLDTQREDAPQTLERWASEGADGVRLGPTVRSPGPDPLAIWRKAVELGLVVSCGLGDAEEFAAPEFESLVQELPNLSIIIEHLGFVRQGEGSKPPYTLFRQITALSKYPNVYIKFGGVGENSPRPDPFVQPFPFEGYPPLLEMAYEAFGATRMMWGSDFPPVAIREGYGNALRNRMERFNFRSEEDKEWMFGKTAASLHKFGDSAG